ncbi:ATP-binding protein [Acetivibrio cellulolyticus]|uniref:ATP-binding protein n=1 Tax=Acetivibrio cellulolyticus TaxID=35830 RepID=UPI001F34358E|nr:ATP-binding protein [Acetivibrio cellulolyticus]
MLKLCDLKIASELCNIRNSVNNIVGFILESHGPLKEDTLFELKVVLNELLQNAIKHGNKEDSAKQVKIRTGISKNYVYFIIEDEGEGFERNCIVRPENLTELCELKEGGRGLLIVRNLCDSVKYNFKGNKIVVLKSLD